MTCSREDFEAHTHVSPENVFSLDSLLLSYVDRSTSPLRRGFFDLVLLGPGKPTIEGHHLQSCCLQMIGKYR